MRTLFSLIACGLVAAGACRAADGFIWLDVSLKLIVDPNTGQIPTTNSDALLNQSFTLMNRWLANTWRGYRVRAVDRDGSGNFKRVGSLNDTTGPGKWYAVNLKPDDPPVRAQFEDQAKANKTLYGWNDYAINIYFNDGDYSVASFPWSGRDVIISAYNLLRDDLVNGRSGAADYQVAGNLLHEIGHYLGLAHTFEDTIADTALDPNVPQNRNEPVILNSIAQLNYSGRTYAQLTSDEKIPVDNTANNSMAYYQLWYDDPAQGKVVADAERYGPTRFVFTDLQLDRLAGYSHAERRNVVSGVTKFVNAAAGAGGNGTSASPYNTLAAGVAAASVFGTDIVLLRPGTYTAASLSKPMTIRVSRPGATVIAHP